jgi:hypothetical protein
LLGLVSLAGACGSSEETPAPVVHQDASNVITIDDAGRFDPDSLAACAAESHEGETLPLDLYVMLDRSNSMNVDDKWSSVTSAIQSFVETPDFAGLGVGIQYFPQKQLCTPDAYATPDVPIEALPAVGPKITQSLLSHDTSGGTPMVPALSGAIAHARDSMQQNPGHKVIVVLATDGLPDAQCLSSADGATPNTLEGVIAVATEGTSSDPPVQTFVIGVGSALTELDKIAAAGGSTKATLIDSTGQNTSSLFVEALNQVRVTALPCSYAIPIPQAGTINFSKVNVAYKNPDGSIKTAFVNVGSPAGCLAGRAGWYYDNPSKPTQVVLCANSCDEVKATHTGRVDVLYGCDTVVPAIN